MFTFVKEHLPFESVRCNRLKMLRGSFIESANLVHKSEVKKLGVVDDENNRISMTPTMHTAFDGQSTDTFRLL